jgi:D-sedoheptulose 7-phosphate isomerase
VPHERPARVAEVHLLLLHVLCDAVDLQLMGDSES